MKHFTFLFIFCFFWFSLLKAQNNNAPVAVSDTVTVYSEDTIAVHVLQNDFDPDGDAFYIKHVGSARHGYRSFNDSVIFYQSDYFNGEDSCYYRIKDEGQPPETSEKAYLFLHVLENPNLPYAVSDTFTVYSQKHTSFNLLENDGDPNGDLLTIDILNNYNLNGTVQIISDSVITYFSEAYFTGNTQLNYRNKEKETARQYFSNWANVVFNVISNPDLPVANTDDVTVVSCIPSEFNLVQNDSDPGGYDLTIDSVQGTANTSIEIVSNTKVKITSTLYSGSDTLWYRIKELNSENEYVSEFGKITVNVLENPNAPVAVDDTVTLIFADTIPVDVLANDYSPQNKPIAVSNLLTGSTLNYGAYTDSTVTISNYYPLMSFEDSIHEVVYTYRIKEKESDPPVYSNWANIYLTVKRNPEFPAGVTDKAEVQAGRSIQVNVIKNDYNPTGRTLILSHFNVHSYNRNHVFFVNDSVLEYAPYSDFHGIDTVFYTIRYSDYYLSIMAYGYLIVDVDQSRFYDSLDINNINTVFNANGFLFNKVEYSEHDIHVSEEGHFFVPKQTKITSIFSGALWIGGIGDNQGDDSLHVAGERYLSGMHDYSYGPVSNSYNEVYMKKWINVWKINKEDILYHQQHYQDAGYEPITEIATWPGNGDESMGQAAQLAPFFDQNNNGVYEPMQGDYPLIRGDEAVFFIFNDARDMHTSSHGKPLGVEIHGMAYAFDAPGDSALWNTVFIHYDLYNRSDTTYTNCYLGNFVDFDLGYAWDDYILCDVARGAMIGYNGDDDDGGVYGGYGTHLPAQAAVILGGPFMNPDGEDNPIGGCDESVNGMNFGNGIEDDERLGMTHFIYFNNSGGPQGDPMDAQSYYNYMKAIWKEGTPLWYGGTGYPDYPGTVGPACAFMFPGNSDTCNWGTDGVSPNGGYNQNGLYWSEETGNNGEPNPPGDRRGLFSSGPFTFKAGDKQELDLAYVFARSYDRSDPVQLVKERITAIKTQAVEDSLMYLPPFITGITENVVNAQRLHFYPNPVPGVSIYLDLRGWSGQVNYKITSITGKTVYNDKLAAGSVCEVNLSYLHPGIYIIVLYNKSGARYYGKIIKE